MYKIVNEEGGVMKQVGEGAYIYLEAGSKESLEAIKLLAEGNVDLDNGELINE